MLFVHTIEPVPDQNFQSPVLGSSSTSGGYPFQPGKSNLERKPIWGSRAKPPVASGVQGQSPWLGCQGAKPREADEVVILGTFFAFRLKAAA